MQCVQMTVTLLKFQMSFFCFFAVVASRGIDCLQLCSTEDNQAKGV